MRNTLICLAILCLGAPLHADVTPAVLFTDNAVLQRDKPLPVWGTAAPGEKVSVTFAGASAETTADAAGKWSVKLPAQGANRSSVRAGRADCPLSLSTTPAPQLMFPKWSFIRAGRPFGEHQ